jgi:hypothetical protein
MEPPNAFATKQRWRDKVLPFFRRRQKLDKNDAVAAGGHISKTSIAGVPKREDPTNPQRGDLYLRPKTELSPLQRLELSLPEQATSNLLWVQAFKYLEVTRARIGKDFETALFTKNSSSTPAFGYENLIRHYMSNREMGRLAIALAGKSFKVIELGEKIITFIEALKYSIGEVAAAEPHLAAAWTGISMLVPVGAKISLSMLRTSGGVLTLRLCDTSETAMLISS